MRWDERHSHNEDHKDKLHTTKWRLWLTRQKEQCDYNDDQKDKDYK